MYDVRSTMYDSLLHKWRRARVEVGLSTFVTFLNFISRFPLQIRRRSLSQNLRRVFHFNRAAWEPKDKNLAREVLFFGSKLRNRKKIW